MERLPMYQKKIAYGTKGFPWNAEFTKRSICYDKGICPVAEELHDKTMFGLALCRYDLSDDDIITDIILDKNGDYQVIRTNINGAFSSRELG